MWMRGLIDDFYKKNSGKSLLVCSILLFSEATLCISGRRKYLALWSWTVQLIKLQCRLFWILWCAKPFCWKVPLPITAQRNNPHAGMPVCLFMWICSTIILFKKKKGWRETFTVKTRILNLFLVAWIYVPVANIFGGRRGVTHCLFVE